MEDQDRGEEGEENTMVDQDRDLLTKREDMVEEALALTVEKVTMDTVETKPGKSREPESSLALLRHSLCCQVRPSRQRSKSTTRPSGLGSKDASSDLQLKRAMSSSTWLRTFSSQSIEKSRVTLPSSKRSR